MRNRPRCRARVAVIGLLALTAVLQGFASSAAAREVRIGAPNFPPYFLPSTNGRPGGPNVDVFELAAKRSGIAIRWVPFQGDTGAALARDDFDIAAVMYDSAENRRRFRLTPPWSSFSRTLLFRKDSPSGASPRTVGVANGPGRLTTVPAGAEQLPYATSAAAITAMCTDEVDAVILPTRLAIQTAMSRPEPCRTVDLDWRHVPGSETDLALAARPGFEREAEHLWEELDRLWISGDIARIYAGYGAGLGIDTSAFWQRTQAARSESQLRIRLTWLAVAAVALLVLAVWLLVTRRHARAESLRAQKAERARSDFLTTMSHEIRTPITGFLGMTSLLLETRLDEEQRDYAETAARAAQQLLGLLNDVLDLSKLESGKITLEIQPMDLHVLVERVAHILAASAQGKDLLVTAQIDPRTPRFVLGDESRLHQVLLNLAANAEKFTKSGRVTISAEAISIAGDRAKLRLSVADTGIGIALEDQERIFEKFEQARSGTVRDYGGSGLGLAITKKLVEAMGGRVSVSSELGKGSTFIIELELGISREPVAVEAAYTIGSLSGRVLVVEDNPVNQHLLMRLLAKLNIDARLAIDGQAAVAAAAETLFDLILMDCQMPILDGFEATRRIRAAGRNASTPIVALTANTAAEDRVRCLEAGMNDFVSKPFRLESLEAVLRKWLPRQAAAAPLVR